MVTPGVYRFLNAANGKSLVGSTFRCVFKRRLEHLSALRRGKHPNRPFQTAWDRDGEDSFTFELLEHVTTERLLLHRERYWIANLKSDQIKFGYNICAAANTRAGTKWSEESKKAWSKKSKTIPRHPNSIKALKENAKHGKGKKRPSYIGRKISATKRGVPRSPEHTAKLVALAIGRKQSEATKAKRRATWAKKVASGWKRPRP